MSRALFHILSGIMIILVPLVAASAGEKYMVREQQLLRDAKARFAPDRRTRVFDVEAQRRGTSVTLKGEVHDADMKRGLVDFFSSKTKSKIVDRLVAMPDTSVGSKIHAVVSVSVANIRTKPAHPSEMATQAILGTPVRVLKKLHDWYYVQTPDEYLGWTDDRMALMTEEEFDRWTQQPKVVVTSEFGFSYTSDKADARVVSDVVAGSILKLRQEHAAGFDVEYPDGRLAYLPRGSAQQYGAWLEHAGATSSTIIKTAHRFFGVPYLWGGTSSKGMDCSGFTKTVYFLNGVLLPRDASQQVLIGEPVDTASGFKSVREGDLLFFGFKAKADRPERVTHVAISLGGKRFIHCSGDVHINSLDPADADYSQFRDETFLRVRRMIGADERTGVRTLSSIPYYRGNGL